MQTSPGWSGSLPSDRMVLQLTEPLGEGDVVGPADVLVAQEQHLVLKQRFPDRAEQIVVARGFAEVDAVNLGADMAW